MALFATIINNKKLFLVRFISFSIERNKHCTPEKREIISTMMN